MIAVLEILMSEDHESEENLGYIAMSGRPVQHSMALSQKQIKHVKKEHDILILRNKEKHTEFL